MKKSSKPSPQCSVINFVGIRCGFAASEASDKCQFHLDLEKLAPISDPPFLEDGSPTPNILPKFASAQDFAKAVLESPEFYHFIVSSLQERTIPATLLLRLMDYAEGWGKPPERIEHTGKDGAAIVTEVRRVIVPVQAVPEEREQPEIIELDGDELDIPLIPVAPRRMH